MSSYGCAPISSNQAADRIYEQNFYYQNKPDTDPYQNYSSQSYAQDIQLNATTLLPKSWRASDPSQPIQPNTPPDGSSGWAQYSVSKPAFNQFVQVSGSTRIPSMLRESTGGHLGASSLLRTVPPTPISSTTDPWFYNSPFRVERINNLSCRKD